MLGAGLPTSVAYGFTREQPDAYAIESVLRGQRAAHDGAFDWEMAAVTVDGKGAAQRIDSAEGPRRLNVDKIAGLKPAFRKDGSMTAASAGREAGARVPPTPWRRWHQASDDIDEQAALLPSWEQVYLQLERGRFASTIDGVAISEEIGLFRKSTDRRLHKVFAASRGTCAVALLTPESDRILFQDRSARSGEVLILPPGQALDVVTFGRFDVSVATLDLRCLPPGLDAGLPLAPAILPASAATRRLADAMQRILSPEAFAPAEAARLQRHLKARLECHVVECLSQRRFFDHARPQRRQAEVIDAARRMLLSETLTQGQVLPVPQWAARLGFSARQLHKLFQQRLGISPRAYAERLRLSHARADLREARPGTTTVAAIATKWGFGHLGRFASSYRAAFGELPSDTARAASL